MINGSPNANGCTFRALTEAKMIFDAEGVESEIVQIGKCAVAGCIACSKCFETGKCIFDDVVNEIAGKIHEFDALIVGSPVYYSGMSGQLKSLLDRLFYVAGRKMGGKPAACIVSCRRGGASATFDQINKYFTISGMPVVSSQYWNQVHGANNTPTDVEMDEEGLQTVRTLARNTIWLMKCIEAGKANGISYPEREKPLRTNFIRH
jgi:multimeric flavodoxin WrbA